MSLTRSEQMARIRSSNTTPELLLRRGVWATGLRFRLKVGTPFGMPDLVFKKARVAVFVDGCFWHGCPEHYLRPKSRPEYWSTKLSSNVNRDRRQTTALEAAGWRVCRLWEHEVVENLPEAVERVLEAIRHRHWRRTHNWRALRVEAFGTEGLERWSLCTLRENGAERQVVRPRAAKMWSRKKRLNHERTHQRARA